MNQQEANGLCSVLQADKSKNYHLVYVDQSPYEHGTFIVVALVTVSVPNFVVQEVVQKIIGEHHYLSPTTVKMI